MFPFYIMNKTTDTYVTLKSNADIAAMLKRTSATVSDLDIFLDNNSKYVRVTPIGNKQFKLL